MQPLSDVLRNVCLSPYIYVETFNQVGQSKSALFMQLSISGIPPECAAFARTSIGVVVVCLVYMYVHSVYICICILSVYLAFAMAHWQPVVDAVHIYKDSSIELNVINMRTQTSLEGRGGSEVVRKKSISAIECCAFRFAFCGLSINTSIRSPRNVNMSVEGKPTRKLHLSSSVLFVVSRYERYRLDIH